VGRLLSGSIERSLEFSGVLGDGVMASMTFQPCFQAVEMKERTTAKSVAPCQERKPPEIFCRTFIMRPSRSTRLLVNGTIGSYRKRRVSCLRVSRRKRRLCPVRRRMRPRGLPPGFAAAFASGG
jgi:hypothetical protein